MKRDNPYIGPRPYGRGEGNFFGREREGKELAWLILAERAVLFYAQSGAGKTSLLNARVIPALEKRGVHVLPVARVGSALPEGIAPEQVDNIFTFSALLTLAADTDLAPATLVPHTLLSYLQTHALQNPKSEIQNPTLLILDQFEEIATTHRDHWAEAEGFFQQVREALDALPGLGVLFVLREDYVAELDPYTPLLPSHLQARFRMTLPTRAQAMQIVQGPAAQAGVPFTEEAAHNLVTNLSRIKTATRPPSIPPAGGEAQTSPPLGGTEGGRIGQYVEPVQLQVVCQQLWESLPDSAAAEGMITWDAIKHYNVDDALTSFYEHTLVTVRNRVFDKNPISERRLRRLFAEALITSEGRRNLVLQGETETAGLPNAVVRELQNHHLLRSEMRGGSRYYELAHDRLVEPVVKANQAWEAAEEQRHPWRPLARQWEAAPSESLLYRGNELAAAQAWLAVAEPGEVEGYERAFIEASGAAERERVRRRRWYFAGSIVATLVIFVAVLIAIVMNGLRQDARKAEAEAERQAGLALSRQLAAESTLQLNQYNYDLGLLLAVESAHQGQTMEAFAALRQVLAYPGRVLFTLSGHDAPVQHLMWNKDNSQLLTFAPDGKVYVWDAHNGQSLLALERHSAAIRQAIWNSDESQIITASDDGAARVWDARSGELRLTLSGHTQVIWQASWSPDENYILTCSNDGSARVWDAQTGQIQHILSANEKPVRQAMWNSAGSQILTAGDDGAARVWDTETGALLFELPAHKGSCDQAVWLNENRILTRGCDEAFTMQECAEYTARIWDAQTGEPLTTLSNTGKIYQITWSADARYLLVASDDKKVRVWDAETGNVALVLSGHKGAVRQAVWSDDGNHILTASNDGTARVWDTDGRMALMLVGHADWVWQAIWLAGETHILTVGNDRTVRIWDVETGRESGGLAGIQAWWNSHTNQLFAAGDDGKVHSWDISVALGERGAGELPVFAGHKDEHGVLQGRWSADGRHILSWKETARVWDAQTGKQWGMFEHADGIWLANWNKAATRILTVGWDGAAQVWDVETQRLQLVLQSGYICRATWSEDESKILTESYDDVSKVWDAVTGNELFSLPGHEGCASPAAWSTDGTRILASDAEHVIWMWDAQTGAELGALPGHEDLIRRIVWNVTDQRVLAYSDVTARVWEADTGVGMFTVSYTHSLYAAAWNPAGDRLLVAGCEQMRDPPICLENTVRVYDANTGVKQFVLSGHTAQITQAVWNKDGTRILTAGDDRTARVWDARTGKPVFVLAGHTDKIEQALWNVDESLILTVSADRTARVWDVVTPQAATSGPITIEALFALTGRQGVLDAQWSPDVARILVVNADDTVSQHFTQIAVLQHAVCQLASRNMTLEEWQRYFGSTPYRQTCEQAPVDPASTSQ